MTPGGCCESTLGETGLCAPCLPVHPGGGGHMGLGRGGGEAGSPLLAYIHTVYMSEAA